MVSCAVITCSSRSTTDSKKTTGVTFHSFPSDPERLKVWINFVNRNNWTPGKSSVLCSKHFPEEHIDRTSLSSVRLRPFAVPISLHNVGLPKQISMPIVSDNVEMVQVLVDDQVSGTSRQNIRTPPTKAHLGTSESISPRERKLQVQLENVSKISRIRKRKINQLRQCVLRRNKKIASLKNIIEELRKNRLVDNDSLDILSSLGGPNEEFFLRQVAKSKKARLPKTYGKDLRTFALTLHYYSPAPYQYVRNNFNTCLPHTRTISRWYQHVNGEPGFTAESFDSLKFKSDNTERKILCNLIMDEMSIRQHAEWDGQRYHGYVDMGTNIEKDTLPLAKDAFVFVLVCINEHWKLPIAYFLINGCNSFLTFFLYMYCE